MRAHESSTIVLSISLASSLPKIKHSLHPCPIDQFHAGTVFLLAVFALLSGCGGNGCVSEKTFIDTFKIPIRDAYIAAVPGAAEKI